MTIRVGEVFWCLDTWKIPMRFEVDFYNESVGLIVGKSDRGSFVRGFIGQFYKSLADCENRIGTRA